jgi:DNA-binding MarR family transcriptional regulator
MQTSNDTKKIAEGIASQCIGSRVRMLNRIVTRTYEEELRSHGIKFSQMNILTVVAKRGSIQPAEIGRILSIEKSTLSRNVRLMEAIGWIETLPGDGGNTHLLQLTRQRRRLYKKAAPAWSAAQEKLSKLLGDQTVAAIQLAVERVRQLESTK